MTPPGAHQEEVRSCGKPIVAAENAAQATPSCKCPGDGHRVASTRYRSGAGSAPKAAEPDVTCRRLPHDLRRRRTANAAKPSSASAELAGSGTAAALRSK